MMKIICGLIPVLAVLIGSAYVSPTYASSSPLVVIDQVRAETSANKNQEFIVLRNTSSEAVDISGWCLKNIIGEKFACFDEATEDRAVILPAESYASVVSSYYKSAENGEYSLVYSAPYKFGHLHSGSDELSLLDGSSSVVDTAFWSYMIPSHLKMHRKDSPTLNKAIIMSTPMDKKYTYGELDATVYNDIYYSNEAPEAKEPFLRINEVLPNPKGVDKNNEYIELYNYGEVPVLLSEYEMRHGLNEDKSKNKNIKLPDIYLEPGEYYVLRNSDTSFDLNNTSSRVSLYLRDSLVGEAHYTEKPKDGEVWMYWEEFDEWLYSPVQTPGAPNAVPLMEDEDGYIPVINDPGEYLGDEIETGYKPCAEGQERNPATNRCRNIQNLSAASVLTPCKEGQERNPETNRCRKISSSASSTLAPCKEGQERNPDTNRCRNIKTMTKAEGEILGVDSEKKQDVTGAVFAILAIVLAAGSYAIWEWRKEIKDSWRKIAKK